MKKIEVTLVVYSYKPLGKDAELEECDQDDSDNEDVLTETRSRCSLTLSDSNFFQF